MADMDVWRRSPKLYLRCPNEDEDSQWGIFELMSEQMPKTPRFCAYCGAALHCHTTELPLRLVCVSCHMVAYDSPSLLVSAYIFSENRLLLMRRGLAPYQGCWAPPAGFVEAGESVDAAISREVSEEVGLQLLREHYMPLGIISLPSINQVYVSFLVRLERCVKLKATYPEALAANWFLEEEYPATKFGSPRWAMTSSGFSRWRPQRSI